ncbi:hypothetical protein [Actinophytocola gossypii]|uniref:Uncharacterized protein n=1 Tax=Actinophytocola gossypii TaxID=2812003 RepID=A0ABT2JDE7_9PSEU|nr:hypothetical protein [Actinophytocola gossypii]MCT2585768.1 hypothetical protein [Actinophytocola gossypii]
MGQPGWLYTGEVSERSIVTAPGAGDVGDAVVLVDAAVAGFCGKVPGWFRAVQRLKYWWYAVCIAVGLAVGLVFVPTPVEWRLTAGLTAGLVLTPVSGAVLGLVARRQTRVQGVRRPERLLAKVAGRARPVADTVREQIVTVLARDPGLDATVHELAWRSAKEGARRELDELWKKADPRAAAARAAKIAEVTARVDDLKDQGKA